MMDPQLTQGLALAYGTLALLDFALRPHAWSLRLWGIVVAGLGLMLAPNLIVFTLFWVLLNIPVASRLIERSRRERQVQGGLYFLTNAVALGLLLWLAGHPSHIQLNPHVGTLVLALVAGFFPFTGGARDALTALLPAEKLFFLAVQPAWALVFKAFPQGSIDPWLVGLCAANSVYRAATSLVKNDFELALNALFGSFGCAVLLGLASGELGLASAWAHMVVWLFSFYGLSTILDFVGSRFRVRELRGYEGLAVLAPRAQALFLVLGFIAAGVPCGLAFVGEDLLVHALLELGAAYAVAYIVSTLLAALSFYRIYLHLFAGTPSSGQSSPQSDLGPRALALYGTLVTLLILAGLMPSLWLSRVL